MNEIVAYLEDLDPKNEDVVVFAKFYSVYKGSRRNIANRPITHLQSTDENGNPIGQTFSLDRSVDETEKNLELVMQYLNGDVYDLDDVKPKVLVNLRWPKGLDYKITLTRNGWEFKFNLESLSSETQTTDVSPASVTTVSVGIGEPGSN
jgi:hypothetical protein